MDCAYDPTTGAIRDIPLFKAHLSLDAESWAPEKGMGGIVTRVCSLYPCTETHRGESTDQLYLHWEMFLKPREWASFACKISIDSITLKLFFYNKAAIY